MARKIQTGSGTFIKRTNRKRPGRHTKKPNKSKHYKKYKGQGGK